LQLSLRASRRVTLRLFRCHVIVCTQGSRAAFKARYLSYVTIAADNVKHNEVILDIDIAQRSKHSGIRSSHKESHKTLIHTRRTLQSQLGIVDEVENGEKSTRIRNFLYTLQNIGVTNDVTKSHGYYYSGIQATRY
jgi:hypothetical protein